MVKLQLKYVFLKIFFFLLYSCSDEDCAYFPSVGCCVDSYAESLSGTETGQCWELRGGTLESLCQVSGSESFIQITGPSPDLGDTAAISELHLDWQLRPAPWLKTGFSHIELEPEPNWYSPTVQPLKYNQVWFLCLKSVARSLTVA